MLRPDGMWLHLPPERKEFLFMAAPDVFVKYMWGKTPECIVQLAKVSKKELTALLREAWESAAPTPKKARARRR